MPNTPAHADRPSTGAQPAVSTPEATERPLHAVVLPAGAALTDALRAAVEGDGPAVLPLSPKLPPAALEAALTALRPTHVVTADGVRRHPDGVGVPGDVAVVIATSGSTGPPKGVQLTSAALRASASASLRRLGAAPGDRWLCCLPPHHVSGLQVLMRAWSSGTEPIVHAGFSPRAVLASGADQVSLVPTQLRRLLAALPPGERLPLRTILLGGAAASPQTVEAARAAGARVVLSYGMSETSGGCVYDGTPLYNVDLKVGGDGLIRIAGPVLFSGYRLRPDLTRARTDGRWFVTSDLGELAEGRLRVLGRADDVINTGGHKVVAGAVSAVLEEHPSVAEVAVVGRPDPEWGERVVAAVVPADPDAPPSLADLREFTKRRLPAYAAPKEVVLLSRLPLLPNGKPDLMALKRASYK
ncbi:O-succinylbenzoic acid--CoA ligase [Thermostaphylospora chromogena]|uniref:O-succinylbenzoic acid--CoA ligase n=1 Tax=Thermostaphylospora chromogena TaxID=35622 RepID=A0A1H1GYS3_9ACTN|nr:O-succinylbenzoic acid--CoA ligase [Thermostaphylospora chromogena]